jgi:hypothetical protein
VWLRGLDVAEAVGWMGDAGSVLACVDQHMAEQEEDATPSARGGVVRVIDS